MTTRAQIVTLWLTFLLGILIHSMLAVYPIFYGANLAEPGSTGSMPQDWLWVRLSILLLPLFMMNGVLFIEALWFKWVCLAGSGYVTITNVLHIIEHASENPIEWHQIILMAFLLTSGICLNIVSLKWIRGR